MCQLDSFDLRCIQSYDSFGCIRPDFDFIFWHTVWRVHKSRRLNSLIELLFVKTQVARHGAFYFCFLRIKNADNDE